MALIGSIRRSPWILLVFLGLALLAFIVTGIFNAQSGAAGGQALGSVGDQDITTQEFSRKEAFISQLNGGDRVGAKEAAWNYLVGQKIVKEQSENIGVGIGQEEFDQLQFGPNYSPVTRRYFGGQTGQVDQQKLLEFKQQLESNTATEGLENFWRNMKDEILTTSKSEKINNLLSKAIYTPSFLVEQKDATENQSVDFEYVRIPFDNIDDSEVEVTDADVQNYLSANAATYTSDKETRTVQYAVINVTPSSQDSTDIKTELSDLKEEFLSAESAKTFAETREGFETGYITPGKLSPELEGKKLKKGQIYGPFKSGGTYQIARVVESAVVADSVKASHILIKPEGITIDEAEAKIDEIRAEIKGGKSFAKAAEEYGQDGTSSKGGDLGTFGPGAMVAEFNAVCFDPSTKKNEIKKVRTQFGWHLVKVTKQKYNNRTPKVKLAVIPKSIIPSQDTQDNLRDEINVLSSEVSNLDELVAKANEKANVRVQLSQAFDANAYQVGRLPKGDTARELVRWAYKANTNDISDVVYTFTDKSGYYDSQYVIAGLKSISAKGLPSVADARNRVSHIIKNQKKGSLISSKISGTDLAAIAAANGSSVSTLTGVKGNANPKELGYEPKVVASAGNLTEGTVSQPIVGNNGVYVVKTTAKTAAPAISNIGTAVESASSQARASIQRELSGALLNSYELEDKRAKFF